MSDRLTDRIRDFVVQHYVLPARQDGRESLTVRVRDVKHAMESSESMRGKSVVICQALQGDKFIKGNDLIVESIEGPASKLSPTVVMHYKLTAPKDKAVDRSSTAVVQEIPEEWAQRVMGKIWGVLREEIGEHGGSEAFVAWVRSEKAE